ncbi:hypothetical protein LOTGIDRAFT_155297 [Lottia gigantea]|uniref:Heme-binding protein 2 n=1 Tax=Lottia gigantea TaxID=225164 RepID=V3ZIF1_LOTGI|nr:hypothetical protein LOTGIDRAFT_155297 [Lottia gigantea]ESO83987.1 hypothetical protein LOTGIDRAFT_155297 [Lottia gigantea]
MALRNVVLVLLLQFVSCQRPYIVVNGKPSFCKNTLCPSFTVKNSTATYETRQYGPEKWIANDVVEQPLLFPTKKQLFMPLDKYTRRNRIPASSPLLVKSYSKVSNFTMMMYVPKSYTRNLRNRGYVYVTEKQNFTAYVRRSFAGNPNSILRWKYEANELKNALIRDKLTFNHDIFYSAIYSEPWATWASHNEIWFIAK